MSQIIFQLGDEEKVVELKSGQTLLVAAAKASVELKNACGGQGSCGQCRVKILNSKENLNTTTEAEKKHLGSLNLAQGERLACQVVPTGDMTVKVI